MAYTASALSFLLRGLAKPVIVTGSQWPLGRPGSDALGNVIAALTFAAWEGIAEVALAFDGGLFRGNRATKVSTEAFAAFASPNHPPLGGLRPAPWLDENALLKSQPAAAIDIPAGIGTAAVLSLRVTPGMPAATLDAMLAQAPDALILEVYGGGTVPSLGGRMADFLARAEAQGMIVLAISQVPQGGTALGIYAAGSALLQAGVIDGRDLTFEAAYAKLHCCLAAHRADLKRVLAGECREADVAMHAAIN